MDTGKKTGTEEEEKADSVRTRLRDCSRQISINDNDNSVKEKGSDVYDDKDNSYKLSSEKSDLF